MKQDKTLKKIEFLLWEAFIILLIVLSTVKIEVQEVYIHTSGRSKN